MSEALWRSSATRGRGVRTARPVAFLARKSTSEAQVVVDARLSPAGQMRDEGRATRPARCSYACAFLPWSEASVCALTEVETGPPTLRFSW